mgnify:CR=1 FL=1
MVAHRSRRSAGSAAAGRRASILASRGTDSRHAGADVWRGCSPAARGAAEPFVAAVADHAHREADDAVRRSRRAPCTRAAAAPSAAARRAARPRRSSCASSSAQLLGRSRDRGRRRSPRAPSAGCTGSMFDEPTVAQWSSITATFACRNDWWYSWIVDARGEQLAVQRARRVVQQQVFDAPLQEQRDRDAALAPRRSARGGSGCPERSTSWRSGSRASPCGSPRGTRARCRGGGAGCRGSGTSPSARPSAARGAARETAAPRSAGTGRAR